jgi:hypothetical protein
MFIQSQAQKKSQSSFSNAPQANNVRKQPIIGSLKERIKECRKMGIH